MRGIIPTRNMLVDFRKSTFWFRGFSLFRTEVLRKSEFLRCGWERSWKSDGIEDKETSLFFMNHHPDVYDFRGLLDTMSVSSLQGFSFI